MSWFGKIVGGTIGMALGGPLGAIAGAAFGHFFDKANQVYLEGGGPRLSPVEGAQMTFFVATFSMLAKIARADGRVTRETLVWSAGMAEWSAAGGVPELAALFAAAPPPLPGA